MTLIGAKAGVLDNARPIKCNCEVVVVENEVVVVVCITILNYTILLCLIGLYTERKHQTQNSIAI